MTSKRTIFAKCTIAHQNDKLCVRVFFVLLKTCIEIFKRLEGFNAPHYFVRVHISDRNGKMVTKDGNLHSVKVSRDLNHSPSWQTVYSRDILFA